VVAVAVKLDPVQDTNSPDILGLLLLTNKKLYICFRLVLKSLTLDDR